MNKNRRWVGSRIRYRVTYQNTVCDMLVPDACRAGRVERLQTANFTKGFRPVKPASSTAYLQRLAAFEVKLAEKRSNKRNA